MFNEGVVDLGSPQTHAKVAVANTATKPLTVLDNYDYARIVVQDNDIYWTVDGTNPTNTAGGGLGFFADVSTGAGCDIFLNKKELHGFKAINAVSASVGNMQVCYYQKIR